MQMTRPGMGGTVTIMIRFQSWRCGSFDRSFHVSRIVSGDLSPVSSWSGLAYKVPHWCGSPVLARGNVLKQFLHIKNQIAYAQATEKLASSQSPQRFGSVHETPPPSWLPPGIERALWKEPKGRSKCLTRALREAEGMRRTCNRNP